MLEDNLQVNGLINEIHLEDFVSNTIFKDSAAPIFINDIIFGKPELLFTIYMDF